MTQAESMAALFARYRKECSAFNRLPSLPDPEFNRIADDTFRSTEQRLCRTPINTKEDAFAALKFIEHELADDGTAWDFLKPVFKSLRAYIEGKTA